MMGGAASSRRQLTLLPRIDGNSHAELQPLMRLLARNRDVREALIATRDINVVVAADTQGGVRADCQGLGEAIVSAKLKIEGLPTSVRNSSRAGIVAQCIAGGFVPGTDTNPRGEHPIRPRFCEKLVRPPGQPPAITYRLQPTAFPRSQFRSPVSSSTNRNLQRRYALIAAYQTPAIRV